MKRGVQMGKKGMNALETIFMLFILIIVVVVVVQMFTKFTSAGQAKLGASLKEVEKVSGYKTAIQTCENACSDYRATGSEIDLINFCTRSVEMDIDFSGKADEGEPTTEDLNSGKPVMLAPIGYVVCEKNIYCPQLTKCNNRYDLDECLTKLCRYYYNKYRKVYTGDTDTVKRKALQQAQNIITGLYRKGECDIDSIIEEGSEYQIPDINWYSEFIESLDCGERLGIGSSATGGSPRRGTEFKVTELCSLVQSSSETACYIDKPSGGCSNLAVGFIDSDKNCNGYEDNGEGYFAEVSGIKYTAGQYVGDDFAEEGDPTCIIVNPSEDCS